MAHPIEKTAEGWCALLAERPRNASLIEVEHEGRKGWCRVLWARKVGCFWRVRVARAQIKIPDAPRRMRGIVTDAEKWLEAAEA